MHDQQRQRLVVRRPGRCPGAHAERAVRARHVEGGPLPLVGAGGQPAWLPVAREFQHAFGAERTGHLARVSRVRHHLGAAAGIAQFEEVLHPRHRRPGQIELPAAGPPAEVQLVARKADLLLQADAGQRMLGIGEPEGQPASVRHRAASSRAVRPGSWLVRLG